MAAEVFYVDYEQYLLAASQELNTSVETLRHLASRQLAESALGAPASGFAGVEQYVSLTEKIAVLLWRLSANQPLPDGNKRTALQCAILFANLNGFDWVPPTADSPAGRETYEVVYAASQGHIPVAALATWIYPRLAPVELPSTGSDPAADGIVYPAEFIGMLPYEGHVITVGDIAIHDVHGYNPAAVYVRRISGAIGNITVAEIIISAVGDAYAQEELDAENAEADRYPLGPKEYWRSKLVGRATYSDGRIMTNEDFELEWSDDR